MEKGEKYLKTRQHYLDLYDRHTVEICRDAEKLCDKKDPDAPKDKSMSKKRAAHFAAGFKKLYLRFKAGERYLDKERIIREWMDRDEKRDRFYESAQAPEDIRCLTCRNRMKPTFKELWMQLDKEDRVLFMYDCPNRCMPRRAFFSDGEEWRTKPHLCTDCNIPYEEKVQSSDEKLVTTYTCPKCKYTYKDEIDLTSKDEGVDTDFAKDRDRFCMTVEEGNKYQDEKRQFEQLVNLGRELEEEQKRRDDKLKENPKGYHLDGAGYTCAICHQSTPQGDNWYDEYGIKCLVCQKAIDEGEIPASMAKDTDSWYSKFDLEHSFNLNPQTIRKWVKEGILKDRTISHYGKGVHYQFFPIADNKDFLPPKKLVEGSSVKQKKDGKDWYTSAHWYQLVKDPYKHLKGYKIMDHLRVVPPEEVKAMEEAKNKKWEEKVARRKQKKK